jgi:tRNA G18 (ribose-2'-O)-methylase SpoU
MNALEKMVNLRSKDLRREGLFVAEGRLLVERSIASGCEVLGIVADAASSSEAHALAVSDTGSVIPVSVCGADEIDLIAGFPFHRGMLSLVRRPVPSHRLKAGALLPKRILILPAITDPGNLGTLLRSALAFGFLTVYLGPLSCDPYNRKALRSSMGAVLSLSLETAGPEALDSLAEAGCRIFAAEMKEDALVAGIATEPESFGMDQGVALVLGNEFDGIGGEWRNKCTASIRIPVSGAVDSLNVASAGAILMWELSLRGRS